MMTYEIERSDEEVNDLLDQCMDADINGSKYTGMTYEQGIRAALEWITGESDDHPINQ